MPISLIIMNTRKFISALVIGSFLIAVATTYAQRPPRPGTVTPPPPPPSNQVTTSPR